MVTSPLAMQIQTEIKINIEQSLEVLVVDMILLGTMKTIELD